MPGNCALDIDRGPIAPFMPERGKYFFPFCHPAFGADPVGGISEGQAVRRLPRLFFPGMLARPCLALYQRVRAFHLPLLSAQDAGAVAFPIPLCKNLSAVLVCRPDATSGFDLSAACGSAYPCVYSVDGRSPWPKIVTQRRQPFDSAFDLFADRTVPVLLMSTLCARRLLCRRPAPIVYMRLGGWRWRWRGCYHPHSRRCGCRCRRRCRRGRRSRCRRGRRRRCRRGSRSRCRRRCRCRRRFTRRRVTARRIAHGNGDGVAGAGLAVRAGACQHK